MSHRELVVVVVVVVVVHRVQFRFAAKQKFDENEECFVGMRVFTPIPGT